MADFEFHWYDIFNPKKVLLAIYLWGVAILALAGLAVVESFNWVKKLFVGE